MTSPDVAALPQDTSCPAATAEFVLPPGVVFSTDPDCSWAWSRLLHLANEVESEQEESS